MRESLWTSAEISAATGGIASAEFEVQGLSIDTRSLQAGDLFVALQDVRDGHDFVDSAFAAGANGALVNRKVRGGPVVRVDAVLPALGALGVAARDRASDCYRVAVTGSVGKTSVKEMLARMFRVLGRAHWNEQSFNNQWGVPLTLARLPRQTQRAVFEIGMNTPGEIAPRSTMVAPHTALVTKIASAHLEGLGSVDAVAREKADIFSGLLPGGNAIVPAEDDFSPLMIERAKALQPRCRILTFGMGTGPDASVLEVVSRGESTRVLLSVHGRDISVTLQAVGEHWALNAAAALLAVCPDGSGDLAAAARALNGYTPLPGRGRAETLTLPGGGQITLIDDSYNANPESMRAALAGFSDRPCAGRRIVALGEMLEIGVSSATEHAALLEPIEAAGADLVFLAGRGMQPLVDKLRERIESKWAINAQGLDSDLKITLKDGDLLLLKGSNASAMGQLADRLRRWSAAARQQVMDGDTLDVARGRDVV